MKTPQPKPSDRQLSQWWTKLRTSSSTATRDRILENYLPLVKFTAERMHRVLPPEVDLEDLISSGIFGLIDAINAYNPKLDVKFETYAPPRIRGAILDELREMDWVPRPVRARTRRVNNARNSYKSINGRYPTETELAGHMGISHEETEKLKRDGHAIGLVSLDAKVWETGSHREVNLLDDIADKRSTDPILEVQRKELKEYMTRGLSRAERLIIILYYFEEMTMKDIGITVGLSESRISQMHASILGRMKKEMDTRLGKLGYASPAPDSSKQVETGRNAKKPAIERRYTRRLADTEYGRVTEKEFTYSSIIDNTPLPTLRQEIIRHYGRKRTEKEILECFGKIKKEVDKFFEEEKARLSRHRHSAEWQTKYRRLHTDFSSPDGQMITLKQLRDYYGYSMKETRELAAKITDSDEAKREKIRLKPVLSYFKFMAGKNN